MICSSWDKEYNRLKLVTMDHFLTYQNLKKKFKKLLEISPFYASVPKATITWGTNPEIWNETDSFVILGHFLSFYTPNNLENQNFEKLKKGSRDAIIVHMYTINDNHMMYASWDMECNRHNFLSFWAIFCPFIPLLTPKTFSTMAFTKK